MQLSPLKNEEINSRNGLLILILQLVKERGKRPPGAHMSPGIDGLKLSVVPEQRQRLVHYELV